MLTSTRVDTDISSTGTNAPVKGNLQTCTAAIALQGMVPAEKVRWAVASDLVIDPNQADAAMAGVAALVLTYDGPDW